jgi:hypothetical protein
MKKPPVSSYTSYGALFSIINEDAWPWIYNNFIQIRFAHEWNILAFDNHHLFLSNCPFLDYYIISKEFIISKNISLLDIIVEAVDLNYYLFMYIDRYYIPVYSTYQKQHFEHEIFISGYNLNKKTIIFSDNISYGKFETAECTIEEFEKAYWNISDKHTFMTEIKFLRQRSNEQFKFNLKNVINQLKNYLYSNETFDLLYLQDCDFGFKAYKKILQMIDSSIEKRELIDIRPFHIIYEHKLLMKNRILYMICNCYLENNNIFLQKAIDLKNKYLHLRDIVLKYNMHIELYKNYKNKLTKTIKDILDENIHLEKDFISQLIDSLELTNGQN